MFLSSWLPWRLARQPKGRSRPSHSPGVRRRGTRLACEQLEDRTVPSNFTAATVSDLIADINIANSFGGLNTITLTAPTTSPYTLTAVDNTTDGANGLPVIAANDNLTIQGNGDTIDASGHGRLFDVAAGASLTLANVTLQGGLVYGTGAAAQGGAIYSSGSLTLEAGARISSNTVLGGIVSGFLGDPAYGGGVYVAGGTATLTNVALSFNTARGGDSDFGGPGAGGGLFVAGGTVTLSNVTVSSNSVVGGQGDGIGASGGPGAGGGVFVAGGTVTLSNATISSNSARGGDAVTQWSGFGFGGSGAGGGVFVAGGTVSLTNATVSSNSALGGSGSGYASVGDPGGPQSYVYGHGGTAAGGGLAVVGGTVTLRSVTVTGNLSQGGTGDKPKYKGDALGGGLFIDPAATVYLDAFTVAHTKNNKPGNIYGSYIVIT